jgi:multidrug transporter EmrE-like cation transporter
MAFHKLKTPVLINLAVSILTGVFAQLLMKYGMTGLKKTLSDSSGPKFLFILFTDKFIITGILLYLISMFFWIKVLSKIDLSVAYPFVSIGIILTVILAALTLGESVSFMRWAGIFVTVCGVYVIVSSHEETEKSSDNKNNEK